MRLEGKCRHQHTQHSRRRRFLDIVILQHRPKPVPTRTRRQNCSSNYVSHREWHGTRCQYFCSNKSKPAYGACIVSSQRHRGPYILNNETHRMPTEQYCMRDEKRDTAFLQLCIEIDLGLNISGHFLTGCPHWVLLTTRTIVNHICLCRYFFYVCFGHL